MANARVKRPFDGASSDPSQRHITNFFDSDSHSSVFPSSPSGDNASPSMMPALPVAVQANLLSVGMRVRKSVPEGYKTGKELLEAEAAAARNSAAGPFAANHCTASTPASSYASSQRELLPFCGIHKVGGQSVQSFHNDDSQPLFAPSFFQEEPMEPAADSLGSQPPSLTSSQSTVCSTASSASSKGFAAPTALKLDPASAYITPPRAATCSDLGVSTPSPVFFSAGRLAASGAGSGRKRVRDTQDVASDDEGVDTDDVDPFVTARSCYGKGTVAMTSWMGQRSGRAPTPAAAPTSPLGAFYQSGRRVLAVPRRRKPPQQAEAPPACLQSHWQQQQQQQQQRGTLLSYPSPAHSQGQPAPAPMFKPAVQNGVVRVLDLGQENIVGGGDFDDADFLDASLYDGAADRDQEMGGV